MLTNLQQKDFLISSLLVERLLLKLWTLIPGWVKSKTVKSDVRSASLYLTFSNERKNVRNPPCPWLIDRGAGRSLI